MENIKDYSEIGEQIFNLVDNDKDKINSFYDNYNSSADTRRTRIENWFDQNVKQQELSDLYNDGENNDGLYDWLNSENGENFFLQTPQEITQSNVNQIDVPVEKMTDDNTQIHQDIEDEDADIMSPKERAIRTDMSDGDYDSSDIDDEDEIEMALDVLDDGSDDVDVVFDIIDGSEDDYDEEFDGSDEDFDSSDEEIHKKRIYLDHHVNKVVESIDDEEEIDRFVHKKYYVMKKKELESTERMNELEDELDKENISYYDFGKNETIAIKIYCQNEVKVNRLLEKLNFDCRCVDIAHYTDNWNS